jgi:hypothetical protein
MQIMRKNADKYRHEELNDELWIQKKLLKGEKDREWAGTRC